MLFYKRGQATIFIIIGILVVAGIVLFFLLRGGSSEVSDADLQDPNAFMKECTKDNVTRTLKTLGVKGGEFGPERKIRFKFTNDTYTDGHKNISYTCYTGSYFSSCSNLRPLFIESLEEEIRNSVKGSFRGCYESLEKAYKEENFELSGDSFEDENFFVELERGMLLVGLEDFSLSLKDKEGTRTVENIQASFDTRFHDVAMVANEITDQEARYCNFNIKGYTNLYSNFNIDKQRAPNQSWIYTVEHKDTSDVFRFAVRSCVPFPEF